MASFLNTACVSEQQEKPRDRNHSKSIRFTAALESHIISSESATFSCSLSFGRSRGSYF